MDLTNDIIKRAESAVSSLLPKKSSDKYVQVYNEFVKWKGENNVGKTDFSETVMLAYFDMLKGYIVTYRNLK